jgi:DNA-binding MarR family transcriptional regulator
LPAGKYSYSEGAPIPNTPADPSPTLADAAQAAEDLPTRLRAAIGRLSRRLRQTGAGYELTPSQVSVLLTVVRHSPLRLADLAAIESINPTMLSRITGRLTERDLIRRTSDAADRRAALVQATPEGRRMRKRILTERTAALQECLQELSPQDRAALTAALPALERLVDLLGERDS